jgi:hypothetical protein
VRRRSSSRRPPGSRSGSLRTKWVYYDGYSCFAFGGRDVSVNLGSWTSTPGISGTMAANYTVPAALPSGEPVTHVNLDAWYYWIDCSLT